jgi:5-(carboxyamino)imidazole ribonucleotide mutase
MQAAAQVCADFEVPFEADVVSAHRMPVEMIDYGRTAHERGLKVLIAGAGGAAHLPGMLAAVTPLPVIGVPVPLKYLDGMDSLLSIVQMPAGVPVATVSIGNARNAGLLAVRILGTYDEKLRERMSVFQDTLAELARSKGRTVRDGAAELGRP